MPRERAVMQSLFGALNLARASTSLAPRRRRVILCPIFFENYLGYTSCMRLSPPQSPDRAEPLPLPAYAKKQIGMGYKVWLAFFGRPLTFHLFRTFTEELKCFYCDVQGNYRSCLPKLMQFPCFRLVGDHFGWSTNKGPELTGYNSIRSRLTHDSLGWLASFFSQPCVRWRI